MADQSNYDPTRHNYWPKLVALWDSGRLPRASVSQVIIVHDDWCAIHKGGYCDCDVEVRLGQQDGGPEGD